MKKTPLVSVIIPVYNGEAYLADTLDSVVDQSYPSFEVLVIDDGSTDRSAEIAKSYNIHYHFQENQGVAAARNKGIATANGEYIAFIDQDDTWLQNKLQLQADCLSEFKEIDYVLTCQQLSLAADIAEKPAWVRAGQMNKSLAGYLPSTLMVRRNLFDRIGSFNVNYKIGSDTEWFFKAKDNQIKMKILSDVLVHRKIHHSNHSNSVGESHVELLRIIGRSIRRKGLERQTGKS